MTTPNLSAYAREQGLARYGETSPELVGCQLPRSGGGQLPTPKQSRSNNEMKVAATSHGVSTFTPYSRSVRLGSWELEVGS
jgi:hypothetical protein